MPLKIVRNDITKVKVDAIVNATKSCCSATVPNVCAAMKIPYIGLREFMDRILD